MKLVHLATFALFSAAVLLPKDAESAERQPAGSRASDSYLCTSSNIGLATGESLSKGSVHHLLVAKDFSEVQVYLQDSNWEAAPPFILRRTQQNEYTAWFGTSAYPEEREAPAVSIGRDIHHGTYHNRGKAEAFTCVEAMSTIVRFSSIAEELQCDPAEIVCAKSQEGSPATKKVQCSCGALSPR